MEYILLRSGELEASLTVPGEYYKGVRFDRSGVFESIRMGCHVLADRWFDGFDPFRHDNVCGASEEFMPIWLDAAHCLKIGVGILDAPQQEYDRFKLYPIAEEGTRSLTREGDAGVCFTHCLPQHCSYIKRITLIDGCRMQIAHSLTNTGTAALQTSMYNHNFFTFGKRNVGPSRLIDFGFEPCGDFRPDSVNTRMTSSGLRFDSEMPEGNKAYIGNLHAREGLTPSSFKVSEGPVSVEASCPEPACNIVFWSNHRVACVEPYIALDIAPGQTFEWTIDYKFNAI